MITVFAKGKCVGEIRRPLPLQKLSPCISPLDLPTCLLRYVFIERMFFISIHIACRLVEMIGSASPWFETSIHIFTYTHRTTTHTQYHDITKYFCIWQGIKTYLQGRTFSKFCPLHMFFAILFADSDSSWVHLAVWIRWKFNITRVFISIVWHSHAFSGIHDIFTIHL